MNNGNSTGRYGDQLGINDPRGTTIQIIFSAILGLSAFLTFCVSFASS